jgi:hypothetical protein
MYLADQRPVQAGPWLLEAVPEDATYTLAADLRPAVFRLHSPRVVRVTCDGCSVSVGL